MTSKSIIKLTQASKILLVQENYVYKTLEPAHAKEAL